MRTVTAQAGVTIDLGHQYDNYATEVVFPSAIISPFITNFGSTGTFAIWYRRSGDSLGYPIGSPLVTFDSTNSEVTWDVVESDTASPGISQVQLRYIVDEVCVMSQIFAGNVADSVDTGEEAPEPMEQWADAIVSAVAGGQPTVATSASAMSDHNTIYLYTGSESGYIYGHIYYWNGSAWTDGGAYGGGSSSGTGLTDDIKQALLDCFEHVAWTDEHGQDYVDALEAALYPPANLVSISAVYTQSGTVYDTDTLDSLKSDLVVTAVYSDSTTETVASTDYTLSGTLTEGTSTITVSYGGKTDTFTVTVSSNTLVEYNPSWLTRDTSATVPTWTIAAADVATAASGFPNYLAVVICNQTTSFPSGYRSSSVAQYASRTSGWTNHTYAWDSSLVSNIKEVVVDGKSYAYITFTKAQSDAAYALWEAAIANNEISTGGKVQILNSAKTYDANMDVWLLDVNVSSDNIDDIVSRLPGHSS